MSLLLLFLLLCRRQLFLLFFFFCLLLYSKQQHQLDKEEKKEKRKRKCVQIIVKPRPVKPCDGSLASVSARVRSTCDAFCLHGLNDELVYTKLPQVPWNRLTNGNTHITRRTIILLLLLLWSNRDRERRIESNQIASILAWKDTRDTYTHTHTPHIHEENEASNKRNVKERWKKKKLTQYICVVRVRVCVVSNTANSIDGAIYTNRQHAWRQNVKRYTYYL